MSAILDIDLPLGGHPRLLRQTADPATLALWFDFCMAMPVQTAILICWWNTCLTRASGCWR